ncbi:TPA: hypothetical protein OT717_003747 [Klebsiella pneumoniae]|nr:hypothetical protein [Klebsiella pneumoniae]
MSGLLSYSHPQQPAQMPVAIDYPAALALRQMALVQEALLQIVGGDKLIIPFC